MGSKRNSTVLKSKELIMIGISKEKQGRAVISNGNARAKRSAAMQRHRIEQLGKTPNTIKKER